MLHTWGRQLQYHPHIHYLVPGGAVSSQDRRWHACSPGFYLPVHALSAIFRAKFRDAMAAQGLLAEIPAAVWEIDWNVNCQAVGSGEATLEVSGPLCVQGGHLRSPHRALRRHRGGVPLPQGALQRLRTMALPPFAFIHRFLQHVLPSGFMKVRYYGFVSPSFAMPLDADQGSRGDGAGLRAAARPGSDRTTPADVLPTLWGPAALSAHHPAATRALADRPDLTTDDAFASSCLAPVLAPVAAHTAWVRSASRSLAPGRQACYCPPRARAAAMTLAALAEPSLNRLGNTPMDSS